MTVDWARGILSQVDCGAFHFAVETPVDSYGYLQVRKGQQWGQEWLLNNRMTTTDVVCVAMNAVLQFAEQELRAQFRYKGSAIFEPWDADAMATARGYDRKA